MQSDVYPANLKSRVQGWKVVKVFAFNFLHVGKFSGTSRIVAAD
jgi:hypothetical protein